MKKLLFFSFVFLVVCGRAQYELVRFPQSKEVITFFFSRYSLENRPDHTTLNFEKRQDGWHVSIRENSYDLMLKKDGLIWSAKTKAFQDISFIKLRDGENNEAERDVFLNDWQLPNFDACPFFGYVGWDWDVIQAYKDATITNDTVLYGVGRAYSVFASNLLNNNTGLSDVTHRFSLTNTKNALTDAQLLQYRYYRHKALDLFKKLKASNPDFETIVGSIELKLSNEYVTSYLDLLMYQNEAEAIKELPDNAYSPFFISIAKNYLATCDKNAILFVNGDTDTYALLYVQAKYNFRPDVTVINCSLLATTRYIDMLRGKILSAEPVKFTFPPAAFEDNKREYVLMQKDSTKSWELQKALDFINNDKNTFAVDGVDYYYIEGNLFRTKINGKQVTWHFTTAAYFLRAELLMLDIISNNSKSRPVYFAQTLADNNFLGLNHYMAMQGFAFKLGNKEEEPVAGDGYIDSEILYQKQTKEFIWKGTDSIRINDLNFVSMYAWQTGWLTKTLLAENKKAKAKEILDTYFKNFPDKYIAYDQNTVYLMNYYYELGETEKANAIGKVILSNIKTHRVHVPSVFNRFSEAEVNAATIGKIKEAADKNHQEAFYKTLLD